MNSDESGIIKSKFPDRKLPNENLWSFLEPQFKQYGTKEALVSNVYN